MSNNLSFPRNGWPGCKKLYVLEACLFMTTLSILVFPSLFVDVAGEFLFPRPETVTRCSKLLLECTGIRYGIRPIITSHDFRV